ncbi:hypothetical protein [Croceibacterium ferulae]|uniref:hypothetical protein n=1 Tax=Croceibacterium ferulae TaxID=1854641 RepID=UPI000EAE808E|nr:hypothetical protein [Croceibacterium ferulae]
MGEQYTARSFKSGNSVAIRVPAGLGVQPGQEWVAQWVDEELHLRCKSAPSRKIDVSGFAGKAPGARLAPREDFDLRPITLDKSAQ